MSKGLGRRVPKDWKHVEKYPLRLTSAPIPPAPVTIGVNWYDDFDNPQRDNDGRYWIGKNKRNLGTLRGGHCVCIPHNPKRDLLSWYKYYNQGEEGACFKAGTLISMSDGSVKAIEDLKLFESVLTAEGNTGGVTGLFGRLFSGDIYKISLWGNNALECTEEHPILTKRGYIKAKDIRLDDYVSCTARMPFEDDELLLISFLNYKKKTETSSKARRHTVRFKGYAEEDIIVKVKNIPDMLPMTKELGRLFGLYLAEGGTTENKVNFTFGKHEESTLVRECVDLIRDSLGIEARVQYRPHAINVVIYGKEWRQLFEYLFPGNVWSKGVSSEVMKGNKEFLKAMLFGWLDGDGHKRRREIQGVTVSKKLAFAMYRVAQSLGYRPAIKMTIPSVNEYAKIRQNRWEVFIRETAIFNPKDTIGKLIHCVEISETGVWRKVRAISTEPYDGLVYNFEVQGDNSYVADGVSVHNCTGFGSSRMMSLLNRKMFNPWWLWNEAKKIDEWVETNPGDDQGSSVRAAMDVLRLQGHVLKNKEIPKPKEGISANRWATNIDDLFLVLQNEEYKRLGALPITNNWGEDYPKIVWMPCETHDLLLRQEGEYTMITDI